MESVPGPILTGPTGAKLRHPLIPITIAKTIQTIIFFISSILHISGVSYLPVSGKALNFYMKWKIYKLIKAVSLTPIFILRCARYGHGVSKSTVSTTGFTLHVRRFHVNSSSLPNALFYFLVFSCLF